MPDMLNTAISGLLTFQRALSSTSHNIANVNTPGYSRQNVEMNANSPSYSGNVYIGNGVRIDSVTRAYDQFLTKEVRDITSEHSRLNRFVQLASHIDDVLADSKGGISPSLHAFFDAVQDVADTPTSSTARIAMIQSGEVLANRFHNMDNRFEELAQNTKTDVYRTVEEVNQLVIAIRDIHAAVMNSRVSGSVTQQSSDLLDKRDQLIADLAEKIDLSVINEKDGGLSIFIGNGQAMLNDNTAFTLSVQTSVADPTREAIAYNGSIRVSDISSQLNGGELGGLLDFQRHILEPTRNTLGRTTIALAETMNAQMRDGMTLNGTLGQDFYSYAKPQIHALTANSGHSVVTVEIGDITALTADNHELTFDGESWTISSDSGSTQVVNSASAAFNFEGLSLSIDGTAAMAGDRFSIKPTVAATGSLQVITRNGSDIAAAAPIRTSVSLDNLGSLKVSPGVVTDRTHPHLLDTATFIFDTPPTHFRADIDVVVAGAAIAAGDPIPYSDHMVVDGNGWQLNLQGAVQSGDRFTLRSNAGGSGDNRNALKLADLQNISILDHNTASLQESYSELIGFVGSSTQASGIERDVQTSLLTQAVDRKSAKVGVNLDEEATDLVRFQQAYEATAQVVTIAKTIFETLLKSVN